LLVSAIIVLAGCGVPEEPVADSVQTEESSSRAASAAMAGATGDPEEEKQQAESVAASFADTIISGGQDNLWESLLLTEAARKKLSELQEKRQAESKTDTPRASQSAGATYELEETSIDGSTAEVVLRLSSRQPSPQEEKMLEAFAKAGREFPYPRWKIHLRRESAKWRVYAFTQSAYGFSATRDYEHPEKSVSGPSSQPSPSQMKVSDPIPQATTVAEFRNSWRKDFEFQNRPAREVLEQLGKSVGLEWYLQMLTDPATERAVSLSLQGRSVVEAIEEVCRQIDRHPEYPEFSSGNRGLSLREGPRSFPSQMVGPFMVYVKDVETYAGKTVGRLRLRCVGLGLPAGIGYHAKRLEAQAISDSIGTDVFDADGPLLTGGVERPTHYLDELGLPLKNLVRGSETLSLKGSLAALVPTDIRQVSFDTLESGTCQSVAGVTITIDEVKSVPSAMRTSELRSQIRVTCASSTPDASPPAVRGNARRRPSAPPLADKIRQVTFFSYGDNGQQLASWYGFSPGRTGYRALRAGWERSRAETMMVAGEPKSLRAFVTTTGEEVVYDFELSVPLPSAALLPEQVAPAKFPGHAAPVNVTFLDFAGNAASSYRRIEVEVVNHSDKPIRQMDVKVTLRDAGGKNLSERSIKHLGFSARTSDKPYFLEKLATAKITLDHSFDVPKETAATELEIGRVVFADATEWTPDMAVPVAETSPSETTPDPPRKEIMRTWTDSTGNFRVQAMLRDFNDGTVSLEKEDGQVIRLPIDRLSPVDQQYVRTPMSGESNHE
jgi:hypothetical protein